MKNLVPSTLPFDLIVGGVPRFAREAPWAWRLVKRSVRGLPVRTRTEIRGRQPTVADVKGNAPIVLVQADPEAYLLRRAGLRLVADVEDRKRELVLPVSNEPWCEEARCAPPFAYHTPSLLAEAVEFLEAGAGEPCRATSPRSPVFAVRRLVLESLPASLPLEEIPEEAARRGYGVFIDRGAYLHRYGEMDGQARRDLVSKVPTGARAVLDVGCSRGATAAELRASGIKVRIVGIEPDPDDASAASRLYDRVLAVALEDVREEFPGEFDAILFGDVLEHLIDPSAALLRVRPWLAPGGVVIASMPNLGHWSVVADLLEGRFEYVPYSILSGTHVRFFTRRTLGDLFEASGYRMESVETVTLPPSPAGAEKLEHLKSFPGASEDLAVVEFLVVAKRMAES